MLPQVSSVPSPSGWLRAAGTIDIVSRLSARPLLSQPSCSTRLRLQGNVNHHSNESLISGRICPSLGVWWSGTISSPGSTEQGWLWWLLEDTLVFPSFPLLCHHPHLAHCLLASLHCLILLSGVVPTEDT